MANKKKNVNNFVYDKKRNKVVMVKKNSQGTPVNKIVKTGDFNLISHKTTLTQKEKNRRRYQARQQKYSENVPIKKKVVLEAEQEIEQVNKEERKKIINRKEKRVIKKQEREQEKKHDSKIRKLFNNINMFFTDTANKIKIRVSDSSIPLGKEKEDKDRRAKRYLKEALFYAIIITIINMIAVFIFDYVNLLNLFDIYALNIILTIIVSLFISFLIAFIVDYLLTELWIKRKRKKEGEQSGNSGVIKGEYQENIQD